MRRVLNLDIFNLGGSFLLYYLVIFSVLPVAFFLGFATEFTNLPARGINFLTHESLVGLLAGLLAFVVGYYAIAARVSDRSISGFLHKPWDPTRTLWVVTCIFVAGFAIKCPRIISDLAQPDADARTILLSFLSLNPLHFIALATAFSQYFFLLRENDDRANVWRAIAWAIFAIAFFGQLKFGSGRMSILTPVLIYLLIRHYLYRRSAARILLVGFMLLLVIFPLKLYMKDKNNVDQNYFPGQQRESSLQILTSDIKATATLVIDSTIGRIGQSHIFTAVMDRTEDLLYGKGFLDFFRAFDIQTFTHRNVLFINDGNDFGKAIGLLEANDFVTGVGPTQIGDMYLNFGFLGIVFGMLCLGILYRYVFDNLVVAGSISGVMMYSILWIQIIHGFEDWLSLTYVRHVKVAFVLFIIHIVLTTTVRIVDRRSFTRSALTDTVKKVWIMGARTVSIVFCSLIVGSTAMSQTIVDHDRTSNSSLTTLPAFGMYQELMRGIEPCDTTRTVFFRASLPKEQFLDSIKNMHSTTRQVTQFYLLGLAAFEKKDYEDARKWFRRGARHDHAMATYNLGMIYEGAYGVRKDDSEATIWYANATKHGVTRALTDLGRLSLEGTGVTHNVAKAFQFFSRAAMDGDSQAFAWLGYMHETGTHDAPDISQSVEMYMAGVDKEDGMAMVHLARLYETGTGIPLDKNKAIALYQRAAQLGQVTAMERLSVLYESGEGVAKSEGTSFHWKLRAMQVERNGMHARFMEQYYAAIAQWARTQLKLNDATAMRALGISYADGLSTPKSLNEAHEWFRKGANHGDVPSMRNLGVMHERALGVEANVSLARKWYLAAASEGDATASKNMGQLHERQRTKDPKHLAQAYKWYRTAATAGNSIAMCKIGRMNYRGESVPRSFEAAAEWFRRAADKGNAAAMNNLGLLYELGRGVTENYGTALGWYERGAQHGNFAAMRNLALMYEKGRGIEQSYEQAIKWYREANRGRDAIARTKLSKL